MFARCVLRGASRMRDQTGCDACGTGFAGTGGECAQCLPGSEPSAIERHACDCASDSAGSDGTCAACGDGTEPNEDLTACQPCAPTDAGTGGVCDMCAAGSEPKVTRPRCVRAVEGLRARVASARSVRLGASRIARRHAWSVRRGGRGRTVRVRCARMRPTPNAGQTACQPCAADGCGDGRRVHDVYGGERASPRPDELCGVCDWVCGHWRRVCAVCSQGRRP